MASPPSVPCLLFLFFAAASAHLVASHSPQHKWTHLHFYWHEINEGPNTTTVAVSTPPGGSGASFGYVGLFDDIIREGPGAGSRLLGRGRGLVASAAKVAPTSILTAFEIVFSHGEYAGSSLVVLGRALDTAVFERTIIGGTGKFRMARGYTLSKMTDNAPEGSLVLEYHAYVLKNDADLPASPFASA